MEVTVMKQSTVSIEHTKDTTDLFILKHKDLDVAMMKMDARTGVIEYVLSVYLPEELPVKPYGSLLDTAGRSGIVLERSEFLRK